jgi:carboxyl-terminal processing protease
VRAIQYNPAGYPAYFRVVFMISVRLLIPLLLLAFSSASFALTDSSNSELLKQAQAFSELEPEREQREASIHIARSLLLSHYRKQDIDKSLSEKVFDNYIDSLDPQKLYFLKDDIDYFSAYRERLHGALKTGQLEPGFNIYNLFQSRYIDRLTKKIALIENDLPNFDFTKDEYIETDRENAKWASSTTELDNLWRKRIKSAALSLKLNGKTIKEAQEELHKRYTTQLKRSLQVRSEDAFQSYMNAFTTVYDPHTTYFSPRSSENFNINMSLSLEGIGAVLQSDNEFTKVVRLVTGGPAATQTKLKAADRIVGVAQDKDGDMINVIGWRLDEVVDLIRGPKKSTVRLEIIPSEAKLDTDTKVISIVRDKVKLEDQAANSSLLEIERNGLNKKVGVIAVPTFYADFQAMQSGDPNYKSTTRDVIDLLNELQKENTLDGLVIDLRGNGGGSLDEANRLTGLFIDKGPTVQIRGPNDRVETMEDPDPTLFYGGPLIVLVDRLSASASEIFAGAIQDYGRGVILGSQTFGKGTVQSVRPLNHGQLKITQAKFYRISGASTQHKGVIPDITVPATIDKSKVGEDSLEHALPWDAIDAASYINQNRVTPLTKQLESMHIKRFEKDPEYQLLLEEIALLEGQRAKQRVTLNKAKRMLEDDALEAAQLELVNKRRKLEGKEPFKDMEAWESFIEVEASKVDQDLKPDFIVKESAEVLLDLIDLNTMIANKTAA